jgi:hypothetical protein
MHLYKIKPVLNQRTSINFDKTLNLRSERNQATATSMKQLMRRTVRFDSGITAFVSPRAVPPSNKLHNFPSALTDNTRKQLAKNNPATVMRFMVTCSFWKRHRFNDK